MDTPRLYCPKCSELLQRNPSGELECVTGHMPLAQDLEHRLVECYVTKERMPRADPFTYAGKPHGVGGTWFCPGCGCPIPETSPGNLQCPTCGKQLAEFIYSLVEFHPHHGRNG